MQTLDTPWQDWIRDNLARGCSHDAMLKDMVKAGIPERSAAFNLAAHSTLGGQLAAPRTISSSSSAAAKPNATTSQVAPSDVFVQEASHLFQYENALITRDGQVMQIAMRMASPDVVLLDNFMTHAECDALCELSKDSLTTSTVVDDATGSNVGHAERTSQGTYFPVGQNALVRTIEARISEITGTPIVNGEGLQILNYIDGGEYRPHFDYFPDNDGGRVHTAQSGQRIITIVMYLNNVTAGGATVFPSLNLSVYPKKGSALYFSYFNSQGQVDPSTLHGGSPVIEGEKWIATKWIREREYR